MSQPSPGTSHGSQTTKGARNRTSVVIRRPYQLQGKPATSTSTQAKPKAVDTAGRVYRLWLGLRTRACGRFSLELVRTAYDNARSVPRSFRRLATMAGAGRRLGHRSDSCLITGSGADRTDCLESPHDCDPHARALDNGARGQHAQGGPLLARSGTARAA